MAPEVSVPGLLNEEAPPSKLVTPAMRTCRHVDHAQRKFGSLALSHYGQGAIAVRAASTTQFQGAGVGVGEHHDHYATPAAPDERCRD